MSEVGRSSPYGTSRALNSRACSFKGLFPPSTGISKQSFLTLGEIQIKEPGLSGRTLVFVMPFSQGTPSTLVEKIFIPIPCCVCLQLTEISTNFTRAMRRSYQPQPRSVRPWCVTSTEHSSPPCVSEMHAHLHDLGLGVSLVLRPDLPQPREKPECFGL